ncbi:hypothetical protein MTO96_045090 [Rhipicephalus appendiculatus]
MGNLEQAKKQLLGPGRTKIRTVGLFRATLRWNGRVCQEEVYVIDKLHDALLGRPAIKSLDILPSLLEVTASTGKLSDPAKILCHYPNLTAGLGLLKTEYRITLLPDAKPSAITDCHWASSHASFLRSEHSRRPHKTNQQTSAAATTRGDNKKRTSREGSKST